MLAEDAADQRLVADIAFDEHDTLRHQPADPGRKIVQDDNRLAIIGEFERHVAADIPCPARNQDSHIPAPFA